MHIALEWKADGLERDDANVRCHIQTVTKRDRERESEHTKPEIKKSVIEVQALVRKTNV